MLPQTWVEGSSKWFWSLLPINASLGGLGILVPLFILSKEMRGSVIDLGSVNSGFNFALIPGALIWGYVIDIGGKRRSIIIISYASMTAIIGAMYIAGSVVDVIILYALLGFMNVAPAPAVSLLLMETFPKSRWSRMFAVSSSITMIGITLGILPGTILTGLLSLRELFILYALLSLASVFLVIKYVPEPKITFERRAISLSPESFAHRLHLLPLFFLRPPALNDIRRVLRLIKHSFTDQIPLLYISGALYFTGSSLFFTSYPAFLRERNLSDSQVFSAYFIYNIMLATFFPLAPRLAKLFSESSMVLAGLIFRAYGFILAAFYSITLRGEWLLMATLLAFLIIGPAWTVYNTSLSTILFKTLQPGSRRGELLGVYSAMTGVGLLAGAYLSGITSYTSGYATTFALSTVFIAFSYVIFTAFRRSNHNLASVGGS